MIEGTCIAKAKEFKHIYASSFKYDQNDIPVWPALAINYTNKTQYLFRINKGISNAWDASEINKYIEEEKRPMPFKRMIYLGDGLTDVPAMKMMKLQGGHSVGVYPPQDDEAEQKVRKLLEQDRVDYVVPADYSEDKGIDKIIKAIIDQISAQQSISQFAKPKA